MRSLFILLTTVLFGSAAPAQTPPSAEAIAQFLATVQTGGIAKVEDALAQDPALATAVDPYGFQAIHVLDYTDFATILATLMAHGADINAQNADGTALAHILIDAEFLPTILSAGAQLELKDSQGRTALLVHLLEADGLDMVAGLLAAGADPNARDNEGGTALDYAALRDSPEATDLLRAAGARPYSAHP